MAAAESVVLRHIHPSRRRLCLAAEPKRMIFDLVTVPRATGRQYSAEEKVRIVIAGLRGEDSVAELCRTEGINHNLYYRWSKDFLEAGKKRLAGDTAREATSDEVKGLRWESHQLKELLVELMMENRVLKESVLGDGESDT
jgi:transposase